MLTLSAGQPFVRFSFAGLFSLVATFFLFLLMQHLIQNPGIVPPKVKPTIPIQIVDLEPPDEKPPIDKREIDRKIIDPPPELTIQETTGPVINIYDPRLDDRQDPKIEEWIVIQPDKDPLLVVRIYPEYPASAISRGIEGYVILEYTIDNKGIPRDIRVIESSPHGVFDKSAIRAISKYKFQPAIQDGEAVESRGIQEKFVFEIEE